jgi:hypothetical protein
MRSLTFLCFFCITGGTLFSQADAEGEKSFATLGNMLGEHSEKELSSQTVFFAVPAQLKDTVYFRVFDPDCGGTYDKPNGLWETNTIFEVYGGKGCISEIDARKTEPTGNYKSGTILHRVLFGCESEVDGKWVSFGPFSIDQGEALDDYPKYVFFKLIVEGRTGNDGNVYALSVSSSGDTIREIANAGIFEYRRTYLKGDSLMVHIPELKDDSEERVPIPLQFKDEKPMLDISIIAEPIDE